MEEFPNTGIEALDDAMRRLDGVDAEPPAERLRRLGEAFEVLSETLHDVG